MNKKYIVSVVALTGAIALTGCGGTTDEVATTPSETTQPTEVSTPICDENGNVYANEQEAKDAGLTEAQYGATYCQQTDGDMDETEDMAMLNATYTIEEEPVTLMNGKAEVVAVPGSASKDVYTMMSDEVTDGDLNGDGVEDNAGIIVMNSAGSGTFYYVVAYVNDKGTNGVLIGDRIKIDDVDIKNGVIEVDYLDRKETDAMADEPTVATQKMFVVNNGVLEEKK